MTPTKRTKTDFITSLVERENTKVSKGCTSDCKKKEITVEYCASLHSLSPTELNIHVKGMVLSRRIRQSNFSLRKGSLEQAFLGNKNMMRLVFQVISIEFDELINCVKVELTDSGEYSGNCIFSEELKTNIDLWSIIEVFEYDIIADKFIQIRNFKVLKNATGIIGDPDPDPIEDSLFLKIHRGDYPISSCRHNQVNRNQMGQTFHTKPVVGFSSGSRHAGAVPCPSTSPSKSASGSLKSNKANSHVVSEYQTFLEPNPRLRHAVPT